MIRTNSNSFTHLQYKTPEDNNPFHCTEEEWQVQLEKNRKQRAEEQNLIDKHQDNGHFHNQNENSKWNRRNTVLNIDIKVQNPFEYDIAINPNNNFILEKNITNSLNSCPDVPPLSVSENNNPFHCTKGEWQMQLQKNRQQCIKERKQHKLIKRIRKELANKNKLIQKIHQPGGNKQELQKRLFESEEKANRYMMKYRQLLKRNVMDKQRLLKENRRHSEINFAHQYLTNLLDTYSNLPLPFTSPKEEQEAMNEKMFMEINNIVPLDKEVLNNDFN